jgi:hypothetical protein
MLSRFPTFDTMSIIDPTDGSIQMASPDFKFGPALRREEFLNSCLGVMSKDATANPPWPSYRFCPIIIAGEEFAGQIYFHGEKLYSFHFASTRPEFGTSWADCTLERELACKQFHERWLENIFSTPPLVLIASSKDRRESMMGYDFLWGRVASVYDSKSSGSSIIVQYK